MRNGVRRGYAMYKISASAVVTTTTVTSSVNPDDDPERDQRSGDQKDRAFKLRTYVSNIQGRGGSKIAQLSARTHDAAFIVLNETNCRQGDENSIALGCRGIALTDGGEADKQRGYGTAVMSKTFDPETDQIVHRSDRCEISAIRRKISDTDFMTVIGVYLSPNASTVKVGTFWDELEHLLDQSQVRGDGIVLIAGDPNAGIGTSRFNKLERLRQKYNGFRVITSPTRGENQPDHVLAFYDPVRFTVAGLVVDGVGDHRAMVVDISSSAIKPLKEVWHKKKVITSRGDPDAIDEQLVYQFSNFCKGTIESLGPQFTDIDQLAIIFCEIVAKVRDQNCTYKTVWLPEHKNKRTKCRLMRKVQFYLNRVWTATKKLRDNPSSVKLRDNLVRKKDAYTSMCRIAAKASIAKDIAKMRKYAKVDTSQFFKHTGMHMRFDGVSATSPISIIDDKLDAAELNYRVKGPTFDPKQLQGLFKKVRKFSINCDSDFIHDRIKGLNKVDKFYKDHAEALSRPLAALLLAIKRSEYFPTPCKIARLALLPSRTIFFLEFLPKLLEDVLSVAVVNAMPPETEGQMAYIKNRSGNLCVAIGLDAVERSDEIVLNCEWDQTKAFDSTNWSTVCTEYEKQAGIGKFIWDYLQDRTYRYTYDISGKHRMGFRDVPMGRGTWPGTILGPAIFSTFQGTNIAMNKSNPVWEWPGKFSDDCSPFVKWSKVVDGSVQEQLDSIWSWKEGACIDFHLTGKKRPFYYIYRKDTIKDGIDGSWNHDLKMGITPIERAYVKRQLGISIETFADGEVSNQYGYILHWKGKKPLSSLSYRLQEMKYLWDTSFMRTAVQAYVVGKLQFAASLYWLRASPASIKRARFDYCMALAAVVGCNTPEIVGMNNCKSRAIGEKCKNYLELCKFLDLPTLHSMAIRDARTMIKQWYAYEPDRFTAVLRSPTGTRSGSVYSKNAAGMAVDVTGVIASKSTLLYDLFQLAIEKLDDPYPEYRNIKMQRKLHEVEAHTLREIQPKWKTAYLLAEEKTKGVFKNLGKNAPTVQECMNTFWLMCRDKFKVLERYHRLVKRLVVTPLPAAPVSGFKRPSDASIDVTPSRKRACKVVFTCNSRTPVRRAKMAHNKLVCWICGYSITQKKSISFECCAQQKVSHTLCWNNQSDKNTPVMCSNVKHYYKMGSRVPDYRVSFDPKPNKSRCRREIDRSKLASYEDKLYCSLCNDWLDVDDPVVKDHLKFACRGVPSTPLKPGYSDPELARRMAALGARKNLHNHNFSPHDAAYKPPSTDKAAGSSIL